MSVWCDTEWCHHDPSTVPCPDVSEYRLIFPGDVVGCMQNFDATEGAALREAFDDLVGEWEGLSTVTMFGCPCYRAGGKVFAALTTDAVVLTRLPDDVRADLQAERETEPFDVEGRSTKKWVQVPVDGAGIEEIEPYIRASYEAAGGGSGK